MITGEIGYIDFSDATIVEDVATFPYDVQRKIRNASQVWALNVPGAVEGKTLNGPCQWDNSQSFAVYGQEGYYTVSGRTVTYNAS